VEIIPVGDLLRQLVLALGAALFVGNLAVIVRERRRPADDPGPRPNMKLVALNTLIGAVLAVWGLSSLLVS
jgi:hypothetical protein